jgi:hypothetical protein
MDCFFRVIADPETADAFFAHKFFYHQKVLPDFRDAAVTNPASCSFVSLSCGDSSCGRRKRYTSGPLSAPGPFPWTAALLADGVYVCGASIIHQQFVMTSVFCALKLLRLV